jgi:putative ABC transport system permease protein
MPGWVTRRFDALRMRCRALARRRTVEHELDEELRFHFESVVDAYIEQGLAPGAARRRARLEHGGVEQIKEECRRARGVAAVEDFFRDLGYGWRSLRRTPGFALAAAGALALGIGVNTVLFSLVYGAILRPLPVAEPDSIRNVFLTTRGPGQRAHFGSQYLVSFPEFNHIRTHARTAEVAGVAEAGLSWQGNGTLRAQLATDNLLPLIGAKPLLGRFFTSEEASRPGDAAVAVLSYAAWQGRFGGALDVVGRTIVLNRTPFTVIGVAGQSVTGPLILKPDVWIPYTMQALTRPGDPLIERPNVAWIQMIARRLPGVADSAMRAEMEVLGQQALLPHSPERKAIVTVSPGAFLNYPVIMTQGAPVLAILFLAVSLVLLVACANVANMLLARGFSRRREMAIRLSMGAGRGRLLQQLLTETLLLGAIGGALGLALSQGAAQLVLALIPAASLGAHQLDLSPDWRILLYTTAVAAAASLVAGLAPALHLLRSDLTPALKGEGPGGSKRSRNRLQNGLIAVQVAVCLVLLVNAGLLLRGLGRAMGMDVGQATRHVLIASFDLRQQQYTAEEAGRFVERLRDEAAGLPGVKAASLTMLDPYVNHCGNTAQPAERDSGPFRVSCDEIGPDFFRVMGIRLLAGRDFTRTEPNTVIVDERFARRLGGDVVGRRIRLGDSLETDREVVGVAAATKELEFQAGDDPKVYLPMRGQRYFEAKLVTSYSGPHEPVARALRAATLGLDPNVSATVRPIEESVAQALAPVRVIAAGVSALGALGLLLACAGVYGVVSFTVGRRRREVGIRLALGADRGGVLRLILRQGMAPVAAGVAAGLALAAAGAQLARAMLYGVSPLDPLTFAAGGIALAAVAALAALVPARAALRVDPAATLRHE